MRRDSGPSGDYEGFLSNRNLVTLGALAAVLACGWYIFGLYRNSSGATLRETIIYERTTKIGRDPNPLRTLYGNLEQLDLTPQQWKKINATRGWPGNKKGLEARRKVVGETLGKEQAARLRQIYETQVNSQNRARATRTERTRK